MYKHLIFTIILVPILVAGEIVAQTYNGPASGSVNNGVVVTTDDFVFVPVGTELPDASRVYELMKNDPEHIFYEGNQQVFNNYVYVEDNLKSRGNGVIGTSFELRGFESIGATGVTPPDPAMAVGPNHVIAAVNQRFHIYDREGNLLKNISEATWVSQVVLAPVISDPQVIYDHHNGRWVMLWFTRNSAILEAPFVICYSDDENPLGTWYMYAIGSELNGSTYAGNWGDYPKIGYDYQGLYINSRQFAFAGGYNYNKIRLLKSNDFYSAMGGPISWTDIWNIRISGVAVDVVHPCYSYDAGVDTAYFVYARSGSGATNFYTLFRISEPISNPVLTSINLPVPDYFRAPSAQQLGGNQAVDVFTWISKAPVLRDGLIYAAHSIRNTLFVANTSLKYFIIDINSNAVIEQVEQGAQGYYYITPAITVDKDHNIAITYSRSADTEYIGAYYSTKLSTDPPGLSQSKAMVEGQGHYGSASRWGDYFSAALDPINQYDIWLYSEYVTGGNNWSTWLTEIRMKPFPGVYGFLNVEEINLGNIEVGFTSDLSSTIIANYGEQDLIINEPPANVGDFYINTSLTFPVTLSTYDSLELEFYFAPTVTGEVSELYPITTNDPTFSELSLHGKGYEILPAQTKTIYSSSGSENNGDILTIDETTGAGTILGSSLYDDIKSISIDPNSGVIYGLNARTADSDIVRVNSGEGDSYYLFSLDIQQLAGIAFDKTGTLYTITRSGDIYTVDLPTGVTTFVVDAVSSYAGITFNPLTNELWASAQSFVPPNKDAVFTVNLATGDTTIVGHTGLGKVTNDIVFDENLNLYGVIGSASEINDFISIDASTGVGTIVGSVGYKNIVGLAYEVTGVTSVEGTDDNTVPTEYDLSQNYPNPFNPSTSIEFSVPVNSAVTLTIYNLLGQTVKTLVNEEISAGNYSVLWNGEDQSGLKVSSGVYLYKMQANGTNGQDFQQIRKMVLLK